MPETPKEPGWASTLMLIHVAWFLFLPALALAGLFVMGEPIAKYYIWFGWLPVAVFHAFIGVHYRLSTRLFRATIITFAVPVQVIGAVLLLGDSLSFCLIELAFVELFALTFALAITMSHYKPSGDFGVFVGFCLLTASCYGFGQVVVERYTEAGHLWIGLLIVVLLTAIIEHMVFLAPMASRTVEAGKQTFSERIVDSLLGPQGETVGLSDMSGATILVGLGAWFLSGAISAVIYLT